MSVTVEVSGGIATVTIDNPPVNALSKAVRQGLADALAATEADDMVRAVVLAGAGKAFIAGADIREFGQPPEEPHLPDLVRALDRSRKPWIAAIDGVALGGGLEVALGCTYRVAGPNAKLGLPEVNIGIIPGAGGTVLLPRVLAAEAALEIIAGGKPVAAARAADLGLIDRLVEEDVIEAARSFAAEVAAATPRAPLAETAAIGPKDAAAFAASKAQISARARGQKAPLEAIAAIERALTLDVDAAFAAERSAFQTLRDDPQSTALRRVFFAERSVSKLPHAEGAAPRPVTEIGVVGGGTMGAGIAAACLLSGLSAIMVERDDEALQAGLSRVSDVLDGAVDRKRMSPMARAKAEGAFRGSTEFAALRSADVIVEAVFEDMEVKKQVFAALDDVARPDAVLASNTSYLDIDEIAGTTREPSRVIGLHFFSPAHIMKLLELIVTREAAPDVLATGLALGKRLGKITVPAGVCDGFIGNRIMAAYREEADFMLEDGALPQDVDAAMTAFGFPMGVFQMADLAGLDIGWAKRKRQAATRDPNARYVDIADRLCEQGRLGRKTGKGWYDYSEDKTGQPDPEVERLIEDASHRRGITRHALSDTDIMDRILRRMQAEGRAILSEGVASSPEAIDVVMINGFGFPRWRGGPMYMAQTP